MRWSAPDQGRRGDNPVEQRVRQIEPERLASLLRDERDLAQIRSRWYWRMAKRLKSLIRREPSG